MLLSINSLRSQSELELLIASLPLLGLRITKPSIPNVLAQGRRNKALSSREFDVNFKEPNESSIYNSGVCCSLLAEISEEADDVVNKDRKRLSCKLVVITPRTEM